MHSFLVALLLATGASAQVSDADFKVYTEHPRLLLKPQRLRLLKRERERKSPRWGQFELLVRGGAQLPEKAFASALFSIITGDHAFCRTAVGSIGSAREAALVLDWCDATLSPADREAVVRRLRPALATPLRDFSGARDRAFAALVIDDPAALRDVVASWWRSDVAPALRQGRRSLRHEDMYPFLELLHVVRDNLQIDLRDDILPVFRDLAVSRILSYYPAVWPAAENEYRIPYLLGKGDPDLRLAAATRASELALVAYETNAQEMQFLQGWLMHDRFVLRSAFGAPYEFLWANPYQPGLPFEKLPLRFHDARTGTLLVRSSWDEDAAWVGWFGSSGQIFSEGRMQTLRLLKPVQVGESMLISVSTPATRFQPSAEGPENWYILGLKPNAVYDIEVDGEGMYDARSDRAGILALAFPRRSGQTVIVHEPRKPLSR